MKLLTNDEVISILEKDKGQNKYLKANKKVDLFSDDMVKIVERNENPIYANTDGNLYLISEGSSLDGLEKTTATENNTIESMPSLEPSPRKAIKKRLSGGIRHMYLTEPRSTSNVIEALRVQILEKEFNIEKGNLLGQLKSNISKAEESCLKDMNSQKEKFLKLKKEKLMRQSDKSNENIYFQI